VDIGGEKKTKIISNKKKVMVAITKQIIFSNEGQGQLRMLHMMV
jgi:hypothetical protein